MELKQKEVIKPLGIHQRNIKQKEQSFHKKRYKYPRDHPFQYGKKIR